MNYQYLLYFKVTSEMQNYSRAAKALFVSEPALSKGIRRLEAELGVTLFKKIGRKNELTNYGKVFYNYVEKAITSIDQGKAEIQKMAEDKNNRIHISALASMYSMFLPVEVNKFHSLYPKTSFSFEYKFTSAVINDVIEDHVDFGICSNVDPVLENLPIEVHTLFQEPICLIVSNNHHFSKVDVVSIPMLRGESFIAFYKSRRGTNKILYDLCKPYGFEPEITEEAYNDFGVMSRVALNNGIAIFPENSLYNTPANIKKITLDTNHPLSRSINLIWRKKRSFSGCCKKFRDQLLHSSFNI